MIWVILGGCFVISIIAKAITSIITSSARERSRREIAAYVAEGSISPEQGERLMSANVKRSCCDEIA